MRALAALALAVALTTHTRAPSAQDNADELAKKLSNPVASLISVPMQYNIDFDIGSESGTKHYLNVQPVIPRDLSEHTKLITRVIMPVIYQDDVFGNSGDQFGLGDTTPSFFFSPNEPIGGWIVGAGSVSLLPTATDELLGSEKWRWPDRSRVAANARGLDLWRVGKPRQVVCGRRRPQRPEHTFIQPFLARQFPGGRTVTVNLESSYDWNGGQWNVPVNLVYSKVTKLGSQMLSWAGGVRYFVETPGDGPEWGDRLVLTLMFPGS